MCQLKLIGISGELAQNARVPPQDANDAAYLFRELIVRRFLKLGRLFFGICFYFYLRK